MRVTLFKQKKKELKRIGMVYLGVKDQLRKSKCNYITILV